MTELIVFFLIITLALACGIAALAKFKWNKDKFATGVLLGLAMGAMLVWAYSNFA